MPVEVEVDRAYTQIGIKSHGKGIFYKEPVTGKELGNKRVFWIEPNCFVVNIVFAWERAVARTTDKEKGFIASHRFPMYRTNDTLVDLDYITIYFVTNRGQNILQLASPGGAGRNKTLGQSEFMSSTVWLPCLKEQQKTAKFLTLLDKRIAKQRELVENLKSYKRGVLSAIFRRKIRFRDKDGNPFPEWEKRLFSDIFLILPNNTLSRSELTHSDNGVYNVHYGDVLIKFGAYIDFEKDNVPTINSSISLNTKSDQAYLKDGDVVFADTAEDYTVGKVSEIYGLNNRLALSGLHTIPCRPTSHFAPKYLGYYLNSFDYREQLLPIIQGSKVSSISRSELQNTYLEIPNYDEQIAISDYLSSIDKKIDSCTYVADQLLEYRKAILHQLFI